LLPVIAAAGKSSTMKNIYTVLVALSLSLAALSQEKELEQFRQELNTYIDFINGKISSIPLNESNQLMLRKKIDQQFKTFVLHKNSYQYDKWITSKEQSTEKFIRLDGRVSVNLKAFIMNHKTFVVYSYTSRDKMNFYIKDEESNTVVYEGDSKSYLIDNLFWLDDTHVLLIKKNGDRNTSRAAAVLSTQKKPWTMTKGFEGNAFGQVPADYFKKKYVASRELFQLDCEIEFVLTGQKDINTIIYNGATKTLSYKQYTDNKKFNLITARWENNKFKIDDYSVQENLSASGIAVPR
jgi:hypothetical protein